MAVALGLGPTLRVREIGAVEGDIQDLDRRRRGPLSTGSRATLCRSSTRHRISLLITLLSP
jgi:hypothetical protein